MQSAGGGSRSRETLLQVFLQRQPGEEEDGASANHPARETLIPWQLSSKTIEAYKPLEIDKVVSNVICKIQFPCGKSIDVPSRAGQQKIYNNVNFLEPWGPSQWASGVIIHLNISLFCSLLPFPVSDTEVGSSLANPCSHQGSAAIARSLLIKGERSSSSSPP